MKFQANGNQKKVGVATLTLDQIDFKLNIDKQDKEGHYVIKRSIHQEDTPVINICSPKIRALKYKKQILTEPKGKINSKTIIAEYFSISFIIIDK